MKRLILTFLLLLLSTECRAQSSRPASGEYETSALANEEHRFDKEMAVQFRGLSADQVVRTAKTRWLGKQVYLRFGEVKIAGQTEYSNLTYWLHVTITDVRKGTFDPVLLGLSLDDGRMAETEIDPTKGDSAEQIERPSGTLLEKDPRSICPYPKEIWKKIESARPAVGMNEEEVVLTWGMPKATRTKETADGETLFWIFHESDTIIFRNGLVVEIDKQ